MTIKFKLQARQTKVPIHTPLSLYIYIKRQSEALVLWQLYPLPACSLLFSTSFGLFFFFFYQRRGELTASLTAQFWHRVVISPQTHQRGIIKSNQVVQRCSPHADTKRQRRARSQPTEKTNAVFDERAAPRTSVICSHSFTRTDRLGSQEPTVTALLFLISSVWHN